MHRHDPKTKTRPVAALATAGLVLTACFDSGSGSHPAPATTVMRHGTVRTMDANRTRATALAVRDGRIVAVGDDAAMNAYIGPETTVVDLHGRTVLPGFIDAHIHPVMGGERLAQCSVDGVQMDVAAVVSYAQTQCLPNEGEHSADAWFEVVNVNPAGFVATATDLDAISATRPVALHGIDGHTEWVNHAALTAAGITADTPDPAGGQIERDAQGQPTGFLKDSAQGLVDSVIPPLPLDRRVTLARQAMDLARSHGITSVQDAWAGPDVMDVYEEMERTEVLDMHVRATLMSDIVDDEAEYQRLIGIRAHFQDHPLVRADAVKIFSDGVIEYPTQTAAMTRPYLDADGHPTTNYGGRYFDPAVLDRYVTRLDKEGFTVHVHSIGDYTTHVALDAFEAARTANGPSAHHHEIAHLQIVDPVDFPRFAQLGVVANFQLFWALPDEYSIDAVQPYIDADLHRYMYPAASLKAAGATIVGGSDWPVDAMPGDPMPNTPLSATQIALTRTFPFPDSPYTGQSLHPEEDVDLDTMMAAYTIRAAEALGQADTTGSLEPGKLADLVVLDQDPWNVAPSALLGVTVQQTWFGGRVVYDVASASAQATVAKRSQQQAALKSLAGHAPARRPLRDHAHEVHPAISRR